MSAYHAIHASPYDDACPDCAGFTEPEPEPAPRGWWFLAGVLILIAAVVLYALVKETAQ